MKNDRLFVKVKTMSERVSHHFPYLSILINEHENRISSDTQNSLTQLDELEAGQRGLIVSIVSKTSESSQQLMAMGIVPDATVRMMNNFAHYIVFKVDQKKFAADKDIAARILVRKV
jgi:Fe2+ transport system protein FeoA